MHLLIYMFTLLDSYRRSARGSVRAQDVSPNSLYDMCTVYMFTYVRINICGVRAATVAVAVYVK